MAGRRGPASAPPRSGFARERELPLAPEGDRLDRNEIAAARTIYNGNVRIYSNRIGIFPVSFYADLLGFEPAAFFQAEDAAREPVSATAASA
jgi:hypothetical protein